MGSKILQALSSQLGRLHKLEVVGDRGLGVLSTPADLLLLHDVRHLVLHPAYVSLASPEMQHLLRLPHLRYANLNALKTPGLGWRLILLANRNSSSGLSHLATMSVRAPLVSICEAIRGLSVVTAVDEVVVEACEPVQSVEHHQPPLESSKRQALWEELGTTLAGSFKCSLRALKLTVSADAFRIVPFTAIFKSFRGLSLVGSFDCVVSSALARGRLPTLGDVAVIAKQWPHLQHLGLSLSNDRYAAREGEPLIMPGPFLDVVQPFSRLKSFRCGPVQPDPLSWRPPPGTHSLEVIDVFLSEKTTWDFGTNETPRRDLVSMVWYFLRCFPNLQTMTMRGHEYSILSAALELGKHIDAAMRRFEDREKSNNSPQLVLPVIGDVVLSGDSNGQRIWPCLLVSSKDLRATEIQVNNGIQPSDVGNHSGRLRGRWIPSGSP
jgi:hypothetical protein